jgi:isopenicillin-N epimerase
VTRPAPSPLARHWGLDPAVVFLNHGSFGAVPTTVLEVQRALQARLQAEPVRFVVEEQEGLLDDARAAVAAFVGADPDDVAFVANATVAVNTIVRSLRFAPGDEVLATTHEYNACLNVLRVAAEQGGPRLVVAELPFPVSGPDGIVDAVLAGVTPRTRLALVSHVTSPTGLVLPVERLVPALAARGVDTLVDGAHVPGMLPLDVTALGAAYYTGNFHKWACAPPGSAFLHVRRDRQAAMRPLVISHGANSPRTDRTRFRIEFDYTGFVDPTPWLATPAALRAVAALVPGGWPEVMRRNRALALEARMLLCDALEVAPPAPEAMLGSMAAVALPDRPPTDAQPTRYHDPLQDRLLSRWGIQVPIIPFPAPPRRLVRLSAQLYNSIAQFEYLAGALRAELGRAAPRDAVSPRV